MKKILKMLKPYRGTLVLSIIFSALYAVLEILIPVFTKYILSEGIISKQMDKIISYGLIMLLLTLLGVVTSLLNTYFSTVTSVNYAMNIRNIVFAKVSHLSQSDVDKIGVSSLMTRTTNDVRQVHDMILNSLKSILPVPIMLVGGFYMAYSVSAKLLKTIFIVIPVLLLITVFLLIFIMPMFSKIQKLLDKLNFVLRGKISGIRVIRAFNKMDYEDERFNETNKKLTRISLIANRVVASLIPFLTVALYSLICYIISMSVYDAADGAKTQQQILDTIPNMYMFISYFTLIIGAFATMMTIVVGYPKAAVSAKRISEILDATPQIADPENPKEPNASMGGTVEFRDVSFRYPPADDGKKKKQSRLLAYLKKKSAQRAKQKAEEEKAKDPEAYAKKMAELEEKKAQIDKEKALVLQKSSKEKKTDEDALKSVSFTAKPGEVTAIIGITGSGKSTLVNLIPRLYDATGGSVVINGVDVRDISLSALHDMIAYVPQQSYLFSGSIRDNIKFGNEDATDNEIWRAIEIAQAKTFVSEMKDGLDSFVSQAGKNFSGGQKQRLAIARAVVKKAQIYIFDDSFSALDLATDARLRAALKANLPESNIFIVAQRVGTVINADRIIVLDDGNAVGIGTHAQLLESCETYRSIVESQLSDKEASA